MKKCKECGRDYNETYENDRLCLRCKKLHSTNKKWYKWFQTDKMDENPTKLDKKHIHTI